MKGNRRRPDLEKHYAFILEEFEAAPSLLLTPMFSCLGIYLGDKLMLVVANKDEPWSGALVPTNKEFHASLQAEFSKLEKHPVLGKWLYISQHNDGFEDTVLGIIQKIFAGDPRLGVIGNKKKKRSALKKDPRKKNAGRLSRKN